MDVTHGYDVLHLDEHLADPAHLVQRILVLQLPRVQLAALLDQQAVPRIADVTHAQVAEHLQAESSVSYWVAGQIFRYLRRCAVTALSARIRTSSHNGARNVLPGTGSRACQRRC